MDRLDILQKEIDELEEMLEEQEKEWRDYLGKYERTLQWYADENNYTGQILSVDEGIIIPIDLDKGKRATEALAGGKDG